MSFYINTSNNYNFNETDAIANFDVSDQEEESTRDEQYDITDDITKYNLVKECIE